MLYRKPEIVTVRARTRYAEPHFRSGDHGALYVCFIHSNVWALLLHLPSEFKHQIVLYNVIDILKSSYVFFLGITAIQGERMSRCS